MEKAEKALSRFKQGFNCAQSILSIFGPELGLEEDAALKLGQGFGAGIGRMALTCGAVSGAYMVIGLKYGSSDAENKAAREKVYEVVREFTRRFEEKHGSIVCRELLGCDLSAPEGLTYAKEHNLIEKLCAVFVRDAVEMLEEIL